MGANIIRQEKEYIIKEKELLQMLGVDEKDYIISFHIERTPEGGAVRIVTSTQLKGEQSLGGYRK